jgi:hypothetical protein
LAAGHQCKHKLRDTMIAGIALAHHATLAIRNAVNIDVSITTLTPLGSCRERSREPGAVWEWKENS